MNNKFFKLSEFSKLEKAVKAISNESLCIETFKNLNKTGASLNLNDLIYTGNGIYCLLSDGTLEKVLLYIGERYFSLSSDNDYENSIDPTFHLFKCEIIDNHLNDSSKKYKVTTRKDGYFLVKDFRLNEDVQLKEKKSYKKLQICNFCLMALNRVMKPPLKKEDFNLTDYNEYLKSNESNSFIDVFDEIPGKYRNEWQEIKTSLKIMKNYTCEKCGLQLDKFYAETFLDIHFNTVKLNCEAGVKESGFPALPENRLSVTHSNNKFMDKVKVLCLKCHSEEPGHEHIKSSPKYENCFNALKKILHMEDEETTHTE